jgi:TrmH family RNA methyltransferase
MAKTEQITSLKDERIQAARELGSAARRKETGKALLLGAEPVQWALESHLPIEHVLYHPSVESSPLLSRLSEQGITCYSVSDGILKKISDSSYLIPLIGVARLPETGALMGMGDFVIVLDRVVDHGNLGTIIRTANAFGIHHLVSTTPDLDLSYKKIIDASRGTVFQSRLHRFPSGNAAIAALKEQGYQVVATSPYARDLQGTAPLRNKPIALVVGNETDGISEEITRQADVVVQIPMSGTVESLNVGVAAGISMYELKMRMVLTMLVSYIRSNMGREVNVTGKLIQDAFDASLRKFTDLNGTQVILLMMLKCDQVMTLKQVEKDTFTFGPECDALLAPLFGRRYIRSLPDAESIQITDEGERVLAQLWSAVEKAEQGALAGFSDQEKTQLRDFLQRIQANCNAIINEADG